MQQFLYSRVWAGVEVDVGGVEGLEIGQGGVDQGIIRSARQRLPYQVAYAVAHHGAVLLQTVERKSADRQGMVHCRRQVFQGVQQRAVEIKKDEFVWGCHAGFFRFLFKMQR